MKDMEQPGRPILARVLRPGILELRLNRPERLNALDQAMVDELLEMLDKAGCEDPDSEPTKVLLLRGVGRAFCAGADLKERNGMSESERYAHNRAINRTVNALADTPFPTIAVINGLALGGGCELALACDLRFAADAAIIGLTEARIGAIPGAGGSQRLPRLIGTARALEMMYSGEPITVETAARWGLVNGVAPAEDLDATVLAIAETLASRSRGTAAILKRVVYDGLDRPLADGLGLEHAAILDIFRSDAYAEGLAAFAEKRAPDFDKRRI
ncbi:MAG: enoyl-CoA hydratase/isomerase family protein [Rhodospirillum sp.]|nr:enoyl-CoA hydratase/isomerase family protein [Rhodospirillum sp.]MCF8489717.1 enoyl-CoA hydratase/isomerase family protein [Rhodospirillum sp.]MCF8501807.1 enoyl-CoA hydratase/isomerase family protein [Rhodospirillum sp.]